jgi:hypothetical protein
MLPVHAVEKNAEKLIAVDTKATTGNTSSAQTLGLQLDISI